MADVKDKVQVTLTDDEIQSAATAVDRRSALAILGATVFGASATALATGCEPRPQVVYTQQPMTSGGTVVVSQPQPVVVQQGGWSQNWQSGVTDSDGGPNADPAGNGRGPRRGMQTGLTDADAGQLADPAGYGRGTRGGAASGITDSDSGPGSDPAGNGRGTARLGYTGITDADGGPYADPAGHGRGRWR